MSESIFTLAGSHERARVEAFQERAYARTAALIGSKPIPLQWDYAEVFETCEIWLLEEDSMLQGVLIIRFSEDGLFLESIATAPDCVGKGIAKILMTRMVQRAQQKAVTKLSLLTNGLNPAIAWYQKLGFQIDRRDVSDDRVVVFMSARTEIVAGQLKG